LKSPAACACDAAAKAEAAARAKAESFMTEGFLGQLGLLTTFRRFLPRGLPSSANLLLA
jgi:hypothetical protein